MQELYRKYYYSCYFFYHAKGHIIGMANMLDLLQRRCSLEQWMTKLLSDIDISRCAAVASFLELEAAARSCMCLPIDSCIYCA